MTKNQNGDMIKIRLGALWERETKTGDLFLAGRLNQSAQLLLFRNGFKDSSRDPDWILYLAPGQPREQPDSEAYQKTGGTHESIKQ